MKHDTQVSWVSKSIELLIKACPTEKIDQNNWHDVERLLPHCLECEKRIIEFEICSTDASTLLSRTAYYLRQRKSDLATALRMYELALSFDRINYPAAHPIMIQSLNNVGVTYNALGEYEKALTLFDEALQLYDSCVDPNELDLANVLHNLADTKKSLGMVDGLEEIYLKIVSIYKKYHKESDVDLAYGLNALALFYRDNNRPAEAKHEFENARIVLAASVGPNHQNYAKCLFNIGVLLSHEGNTDEAKTLFIEAIDILEAALEPTHPSVATAQNSLGLLYLRENNYLKAIEILENVVTVFEKYFGINHPSTASVYLNLGKAYYEHGDLNPAICYYSKCYQVRSRMLGASHAKTIEVRDLLRTLENQAAKPTNLS